MDLFNGVDFHKGCYVGQEVVSRMKHRGEARKRVVRVRLDGAAPAPGTPVTDGELPVGALGAVVGRHALALLRLDRVEDAQAAGRPLEAGGGVALTVGETAGRIVNRRGHRSVTWRLRYARPRPWLRRLLSAPSRKRRKARRADRRRDREGELRHDRRI